MCDSDTDRISRREDTVNSINDLIIEIGIMIKHISYNKNIPPAFCSDTVSSALVASSNSKMEGRFNSARAIAIRCLWPPLKLNRPTNHKSDARRMNERAGEAYSSYQTHSAYHK